MNNRIDRVIGELVELVDKVMRTRRPLPWPTTSEKYQHRPGQVITASDREVDEDVRRLRLSNPEESDHFCGDPPRLEI